jgi:hypothetical protein
VFKAIKGSAVEMELGHCFRSGELMSFVHRGVELAAAVHLMADLDDIRRSYEGTVALLVADRQAPPINAGMCAD